MEKLEAVEEAKALLTVAKDWSILKWLTEKKRVRAIADRGTAALDEQERLVKRRWSEDLRNAYGALGAATSDEDDPFAAADEQYSRALAESLSENIKAAARRVKDADGVAYRARMTAEKTFDDAERRLSASMARRGAEQAIEAYDLRYKAIAEAETAQGL